ncbi:MAG: VWA domain-containing protein [Planctomycetes bacterium]|nr:VWA domain-containing protein [Planctomycetota bacterium]
MPFLRKIFGMAILGALGAALGALGGESLFLHEGKQVVQATPRSICLLFDVSGSMAKLIGGRAPVTGRTQLQELKQAAGEFLERQDLSLDSIALVVFSNDAQRLSKLSQDSDKLLRSLHRLNAGGTTNLGRGLDVAAEALARAAGERWILLFSDGKPEGLSIHGDPEAEALNAATRVRDSGINIVAIGTGLADATLLRQITGERGNVIISDPQALAKAFRRSERVIRNRQMLASVPDIVDFKESVGRAAIWASLIAIGASLALVIGQNRYLRRRMLGIKELAVIVGGGVLTGLFAGTAGQSLFYFLSGMPGSGAGGRIAAWVVLGFGAGLGMGGFVPNLSRSRAVAGGVTGGVIAGVIFLRLVPEVGDTAGRLVAAAILGLCTGMTLVLVESVSRKAWLVVNWARNERSTLLLGPKPIVVGSRKDAHICPDWEDDAPVVAKIWMIDGVIKYEDPKSGIRRDLTHGDVLQFGKISVEVRAVSGHPAEAIEPEASNT